MIQEARINDWLAAYRRAWTTDDPAEVARLFTRDALYFTEPFGEPHAGSDQIVDFWVGEGDSRIPWSFESQVLAQEGDLYVVRALVTYPDGTRGDGPAEVYHAVWLVTLTGDRAAEFVEYYTLEE